CHVPAETSARAHAHTAPDQLCTHLDHPPMTDTDTTSRRRTRLAAEHDQRRQATARREQPATDTITPESLVAQLRDLLDTLDDDTVDLTAAISNYGPVNDHRPARMQGCLLG